MSKSFEPVRLVVAGVGGFGRMHARTISGLAEATLVGVVDTNPASVQALSASVPNLRAFPDIETAIKESGAEAYVVATRTDSHIAIAKTLLQAGCAVLVEKPLAESSEEAQQLEGLVKADSSNLMVGHILLFASQIQQLLREISSRSPMVFFQAVRHRPISRGTHYLDEDPIRLIMVHDLYVAQAIMNAAEPVHFKAWMHQRNDGQFDAATAELHWPGGVCGSFTSSFLTPPGMPSDGFDRMEVFGEGWSARVALNPQPLELWTDKATWPIALDINDDPSSPRGWLADELRHFCRVVRGQAQVPLGARYQDAMQIQRWLDKLGQLARQDLDHAG